MSPLSKRKTTKKPAAREIIIKALLKERLLVKKLE
jgi:hypothetical protein